MTEHSVSDPSSNEPVLDMHVVVLNNYFRRHHTLTFRALAKRVRKVTVLLSTEMEPDRNWEAEWEGLDVRVQKSWMFTGKWRHSTGFNEPLYVHIPVDTTAQLRRLKPDVILSYELGMRTLLSSFFRRFSRRAPLIAVGNMSDHIEKERGWRRRLMRSVIRRNVDYATYNGPSCKRYLERIGFTKDRLFHFPYCFDREKSFAGDKVFSTDGVRRALFCGALTERKGIIPFTRQLVKWSEQNPGQKIEMEIAGTGPLESQLAEMNGQAGLKLIFLDDCDPQQLREAYGRADVCVFPTLADEWGLVPVEAMASGTPIVGSSYAQSVESLCVDGVNGWSFQPDSPQATLQAIDAAMNCPMDKLNEMSVAARDAVAHITPEYAANLLFELISYASNPMPGHAGTTQLDRPVVEI